MTLLMKLGVEQKLITNIPECFWKALMVLAHKLLSRDEANFKELTTQEQQLRNKFKTDDIYWFLTGEPDTVPEICFNWMTVP
jgi:hypothetical protein